MSDRKLTAPRSIACGAMLVLSTALGVGATGQSPGREAAAPTTRVSATIGRDDPGHQKMLALLEEVRQRSAVDNRFVATETLEKLKAAAPKLSPTLSAEKRAMFYALMGQEEVKLGRNLEGAASYERVLEIAATLAEPTRSQFIVETYYRLAIAYMRHGETKNCIECCNGERCLYPIAGAGVHADKEGSEKAIPCLLFVIEHTEPTDDAHLTARLLLNIAMMTLGRYPGEVPKELLLPAAAVGSAAAYPRFENVAAQYGLNIMNHAGGVVCEDLDGDERLDLMMSSMDPSEDLHVFMQQKDGSFSETATRPGLIGLYGGLNLVHGDYDNDGDADVFVPRGAWLREFGRYPRSLLRNDGAGRFTDVTIAAGLAGTAYPSQAAAFADYDLDGDLDLFVGHEANAECPYPSELYRNEGNGTFVEVAKAAGVTNDRYAKGLCWGDFDGDRYPDLYVSNLSGANRLYRNNRDGTFTDVAPALGVTGPTESFPTWFWDYDNDGALDLYVSSFEQKIGDWVQGFLGLPNPGELPALYKGDGRGNFVEVGRRLGLTRPLMSMGSNFGDLDNDGFLDFYVGTGNPSFESLLPNIMYRNQGGAGFVEVTTAGGFGHLQKGHAIAFGDIDQDGDQDVVAMLGGAYAADSFRNAVFRNPGNGNHWLGVRLVGTKSNRSAIGVRLRADFDDASGPRSVFRWVSTGGSFGANSLRQHIGIGKASKVTKLTVYWPTTDTTQVFENVAADRVIRIVEGKNEIVDATPARAK